MTADNLKNLIEPLKALGNERPAPKPFVSRALASFAVREKVEATLQTYLDTLVEAIPELVVGRRFYEGAWVVGVSADLPAGKRAGKPQLAFTRLDFAIEIDTADDAVTVTCRGTVRDRDSKTERCVVPVDGLDALDAFFESACLAFASRFFDRASQN